MDSVKATLLSSDLVIMQTLKYIYKNYTLYDENMQ